MKCTFCGFDIERGTGKQKFMKDGKTVNLCGMKCEKNMFKLKRTPRKIGWTEDYRKAKEMRLGAKKK